MPESPITTTPAPIALTPLQATHFAAIGQKMLELRDEAARIEELYVQEQAHLNGLAAVVKESHGVPDTWQVQLDPAFLIPPAESPKER